MKQYSEIVIKPVLSEKTYKLQEQENIYTFEVVKSSSKTMVKQAIEKLFKVKVKDVNIINTRPKYKTVGRYKGLVSGIRKAYVKLMPGEIIGEKETKSTSNVANTSLSKKK